MEQAAAHAAEAWAHHSVDALHAEGRAAVGGWPGTMSEARAHVRVALAREGLTPTSIEELENAARSAYAHARDVWLARAVRESDDDEVESPVPLEATPMNPSINKRQKERERQDHQRAKAEKRKQRKDDKGARPPGAPGEDPDIAGIVPGPQPPRED